MERKPQSLLMLGLIFLVGFGLVEISEISAGKLPEKAGQPVEKGDCILTEVNMNSIYGGACYKCYDEYGKFVDGCALLVEPCNKDGACNTQEQCGKEPMYFTVKLKSEICTGGKTNYSTSSQKCSHAIQCICVIGPSEEGTCQYSTEIHYQTYIQGNCTLSGDGC